MDTEIKGKRNTLSQLAHLRDDFSDKIPEEMVTSISPDNKKMVRKGWWQGVIASLDNALSEDLVPTASRSDIENFVEAETERLHSEAITNPRKRVTEQDINRAKNILDIALGRKK